jgi:hypothetical protein
MSRYTPEQTREITARARAAVFATAAPAAERKPGDLVYKTRDDALVADAVRADDPAADDGLGDLSWWQWVERHCDYRMDVMSEAVAQALGWTRAEMREHTEREVGTLKRELELMRRELAALREQLGLERGLRDLRGEVEEARKQTPKFPAIASRLEADQELLWSELEAAKRKLRMNELITNASLCSLRKQPAATRTAASVELKLEETSSSHFVMQTIHPAAAKALQDFALRTFDSAGTA